MSRLESSSAGAGPGAAGGKNQDVKVVIVEM